MSKVSKTQIVKILNDCKFNPRKPGPLKVIADVGNTDYYCRRAIEFIKDAKQEELHPGDKENYLTNAIALLALAIANEET